MMWCKVRRLDDTHQEVFTPGAAPARHCLERVCRRLALTDAHRHLFGLTYRGKRGERLWVNLRNPLRDQLGQPGGNGPYHVELRVKYFLSTPGEQLQNEPETRHQMYLELRRQLCEEGRYESCGAEHMSRLVGMMAQVEWGDAPPPPPSGHQAGHPYRALCPPHCAVAAGDVWSAAEVQHRHLRGRRVHGVVGELLEMVSELPEYGVQYYECRTDTDGDVEVGVSQHGITVYTTNRNVIDRYPAASISYVNYHKRTFLLELNILGTSCSSGGASHHHQQQQQHSPPVVKFHLPNKTAARAMNRTVIEVLAFFRMKTVSTEIKRASYYRSVLGSLVSMVRRKSEYQKLYEYDITCTLAEMMAKVRFSMPQPPPPPHNEDQMLLTPAGNSAASTRSRSRSFNYAASSSRVGSNAGGMRSAPNHSPISTRHSGGDHHDMLAAAAAYHSEGDYHVESDFDALPDNDDDNDNRRGDTWLSPGATSTGQRISFAPEPLAGPPQPQTPDVRGSSLQVMTGLTPYQVYDPETAIANLERLNFSDLSGDMEPAFMENKPVSRPRHRLSSSEVHLTPSPRPPTGAPRYSSGGGSRGSRASSSRTPTSYPASDRGVSSRNTSPDDVVMIDDVMMTRRAGPAGTPRREQDTVSAAGATAAQGGSSSTGGGSCTSASWLCKICMARRLCTVFCPCGHSVCCLSCATTFNRCPICRVNVARVQTAFFI